jgi:hypothetical protein
MIGFGAGLVAGSLAAVACYDDCPLLVIFGGSAPLAGAIVGALIDSRVHRDIYRRSAQTSRSVRLAPVLTAQTKGAYVQLRF